MTQELSPSSPSPFERIKRVNEAGNEFWSSRDFAEVLGYTDYRNFEAVIKKAGIVVSTAASGSRTISLTSPKWSPSARADGDS